MEKIFPQRSLGMSLGIRLYLPIIMSQQQIRMHERMDAPSVVPMGQIAKIKTYRDAVLHSWANRRVQNMTQASLAEQTGMRPSHLADYLAANDVDEKGRDRREMPAKYIPAFEKAVGNSFASQWLAMQSQLTILEAMIADQKVSA
jgi:hypothetical protein